ncbi:hypothetical protein BV898_10208 [Hypsibius exemplaris]|uniref:SnoaL-like domain-containing protein n=1 Tax=Hypsibius exemplaris TaxID=2072580 RepID=A0A1W0WKB2_HYPEX|nr:hypothetical protein BV898_10208 [Hypsibius exemplaris]
MTTNSNSNNGLHMNGMCAEKQKVLKLLKSLETGDPAPFAYVDPNKYIQHNLDIAEGPAGVQTFIASLKGTARVNTVRIFKDGNYVFAHTEYDVQGPKIGIDIFRFENGLIVEHWDNLQTTADPSPSGHTMIDGPTQATDWQSTQQNKALVRDFYQTVLVNGNFSQLPRFYDGDNLIQHNPSVADGLAGLQEGIAAFNAAGTPIRISAMHQVLAEGNFVLVTAEGTFGSQPMAFYDLYRVQNGKIAEHWDVLQPIPPQSQWKNQNGKF